MNQGITSDEFKTFFDLTKKANEIQLDKMKEFLETEVRHRNSTRKLKELSNDILLSRI